MLKNSKIQRGSKDPLFLLVKRILIYNKDMRKLISKKFIFLLLFIIFLIGAGILIYGCKTKKVIIESDNQSKISSNSITGQKDEKSNYKTILFVGDIMLDRGVEYQMKKNSFLYPFERINEFLEQADIVFGNLEGPINKNPKYFSDSSLMFSFSSEAIKGLRFGNFNLLCLANNHTLNMEEQGLEETRELLKENNIDFVGDPTSCNQDFSFKKENIIFLGFNKTFNPNCKDEKIVETIKIIKSGNPKKFLVISIHWGQEYQLNNSSFQQDLAYKMIEAGADLIIGSHPHVIQNIEIYKGKLIFYSLGNFIFDQYFSKETQENLAIKLEIYSNKLIYHIFPLESSISQPFLMEKEKADKFLQGLSQRSSLELVEKIKKGIIEINKKL